MSSCPCVPLLCWAEWPRGLDTWLRSQVQSSSSVNLPASERRRRSMSEEYDVARMTLSQRAGDVKCALDIPGSPLQTCLATPSGAWRSTQSTCLGHPGPTWRPMRMLVLRSSRPCLAITSLHGVHLVQSGCHPPPSHVATTPLGPVRLGYSPGRLDSSTSRVIRTPPLPPVCACLALQGLPPAICEEQCNPVFPRAPARAPGQQRDPPGGQEHEGHAPVREEALEVALSLGSRQSSSIYAILP